MHFFMFLQMGELQIASLELGDGNPTLRIRISRLWEYHDQNDETNLHHIGLVLVDQKVICLKPLHNKQTTKYIFSLANIIV